MIDLIEDVLAPTRISNTVPELISCRVARRSPHVFDLIWSGQTNEKQMVVSAWIYLKSLEARFDEP
jgi:hypothetical protein